MNRLWVRFSSAFVAVILLSLCTLVVVAGIAFIDRDADFVRQRNSSADPTAVQPHEPFQIILVGSTVVIMGLIIGLGIVFSRSLTAPLNQLAIAAKRFAGHDWNQRVPGQGAREIQEVATAFNQMADELQQQETLRRNLMADIAHELRIL